jgi:hypothetical protein
MIVPGGGIAINGVADDVAMQPVGAPGGAAGIPAAAIPGVPHIPAVMDHWRNGDGIRLVQYLTTAQVGFRFASLRVTPTRVKALISAFLSTMLLMARIRAGN